MIMDHAGPSMDQYIEQQGVIETKCMKENPNPEAQKFFDMLATAQAPFIYENFLRELNPTTSDAQLNQDISSNFLAWFKQYAPYQDDELVGLQEMLELDPDVINESLADVDGGGEEIDVDLLKQLGLIEPDKDECMLSENDIESDFDDSNTS
ncbi:hypothetical protein JHK85_028532 [Glycine max]|nr:hypothetical protein JHK85_028532 [Glycine max]